MPVKAGFPTSIIFDQEDYQILTSLRQRYNQSFKAIIGAALKLYDQHLSELEAADQHLDEVNK